MKANLLIASLLTVSFTLVSLTGCSGQTDNQASADSTGSLSQSSPPATTFECNTQNGQWVTNAKKGILSTQEPLFVWQTTEYGENFRPEVRCRMVSERFTQIVRDNGGFLSGLSMTSGKVNGETVICAVKVPGLCDQENMLFTLSQKNAGNAPEIIRKILGYGENQSGNKIDEKTGQKYFPIKDLQFVERF